jgi:hypothetical protein
MATRDTPRSPEAHGSNNLVQTRKDTRVTSLVPVPVPVPVDNQAPVPAPGEDHAPVPVPVPLEPELALPLAPTAGAPGVWADEVVKAPP